MTKKTITAVLCRVGKPAKVVEVRKDLDSIKELLHIKWAEHCFPWSFSPVIYIVDEDGKINGSQPNRPVFDDHGDIIDIIYGDFLIVGYDDEGDYCDLRDAEFFRSYEEEPWWFICEYGKILDFGPIFRSEWEDEGDD